MSAVKDTQQQTADRNQDNQPNQDKSTAVLPVVLEGRDLAKRYGEGTNAVEAVSHASLALRAGEITVLMGPSGSGKSTLLHLLSGLEQPTSGTVMAEGKNLSQLSESELAGWRATSVGFVLQRNNLIPNLTLAENVAAPKILAGERKAVAVERARAALIEVGLSARCDAFPAQVSGGEAARAAIARACLGDPRLIFADEPTGALDTDNSHAVMELLLTKSRMARAGVLIVTHDAIVASAGDRILRMTDGTLGAQNG
jgi:ABC-type lipoprotein export system ATPase subunit